MELQHLAEVSRNEAIVFGHRLSSLVDTLPYPAAHPLARLISATSEERMARASREAFEGMLALAVYTAFAEHCTVAGSRSTNYFKGLGQVPQARSGAR